MTTTENNVKQVEVKITVEVINNIKNSTNAVNTINITPEISSLDITANNSITTVENTTNSSTTLPNTAATWTTIGNKTAFKDKSLKESERGKKAANWVANNDYSNLVK
jgi:hypothetical protein